MKLESALFHRLGKSPTTGVLSDMLTEWQGLSYLSWSRIQLYLQCYSDVSPIEDTLHFTCRASMSVHIDLQSILSSLMISQLIGKGKFDQAITLMDDINPEILRTLRYQHFWMTHLGIIKLRRALNKSVMFRHPSTYPLTPCLSRGDYHAADHFISQLRANPLPISDVVFSVDLLDIELHIRRDDFSGAMAAVERLAIDPKIDEGDILNKIKLMILKARIYDKAGLAQKGFSVSIRAASLAYKVRLLPILWEAVGALCRVLLSLKEFDAAQKLLRSILPRVLECEDCTLAADTFSCLADAHMGLAGQAKTESQKRKEHMTKALECLEKAFDEYSRIEDVKGQCEMMAKRATIMHLNGDLVLANDHAAKYLDILRDAKESMAG